MKSKIKEIKIRVESVLKNIGPGICFTSEEIKARMSKIIDITDECLAILSNIEDGLIEISRQIEGVQ